MSASADDANITSMATVLAELEIRIGALAGRYDGARRDELVAALHEAERQVRSAARELRRAQRLL